MRVLICFLAAVSICSAGNKFINVKPPPPSYKPIEGSIIPPHEEAYRSANAKQGYYGCCAIKAVEMNETAFEMYALFDGYPYYEMPDFCNSWCVYVKMSELKPLLEQMNNMRQDDSSMMEEMLEEDQWTMMQWQMKIQKLQKYCFKDSEDVQSMCAEPDMWSELFQELWNGGGESFLQVKGLK